jgi:D-serine deaminase-like pyridoxal phosphate-dependent protein
VTFDIGTKAVASDPPAGQRLQLLDMPPYNAVLHNEEHFTVETAEADRFVPGDAYLAVPTHVCPTVALHRQAVVVEKERVVGAWDIAARDRV